MELTFHAGTTEEKGIIKTNGGRVFCMTALGENLALRQKMLIMPSRQWTLMVCFTAPTLAKGLRMINNFINELDALKTLFKAAWTQRDYPADQEQNEELSRNLKEHYQNL